MVFAFSTRTGKFSIVCHFGTLIIPLILKKYVNNVPIRLTFFKNEVFIVDDA